MAIMGLGIMLMLAAVVGIVIALIAFLPPFRKLGRLNASVRTVKYIVFGLLAFVCVFGGYTLVVVEAFLYIEEPCCANTPTQDEIDTNKTLLGEELWLRLVVSPVRAQDCYVNHHDVCQLADRLTPKGSTIADPQWPLVFMGICGCLAGGVSVSIIRKFSRSGLSIPPICRHPANKTP